MSTVSVIIPTFNRKKTILRAIESAKMQKNVITHIIVVDDNSTDGTFELLHNMSDIDYIKFNENHGACYARNIGIEHSDGEYIAFLDSDDYWLEEKSYQQIQLMKKDNTSFCFCSSKFQNANGRTIIKPELSYSINNLHDKLLINNVITTGSIIGRKQIIQKYLFDESIPRYQDWDLVLRISKNEKFSFLNEPLLIQEQLKDSITLSSGFKKSYLALKKIYNKNMDSYKENKEAYQQIAWLIGFNSMYCDAKDYSLLWQGATYNKINMKRILIYYMFRLHLDETVKKMYLRAQR